MSRAAGRAGLVERRATGLGVPCEMLCAVRQEPVG